MQRISDGFMYTLKEAGVSFTGKMMLEVGCGNGERSVGFAVLCKKICGIDPDMNNIQTAKSRNIANAHFAQGVAQYLRFVDNSFDLVFFHHVPTDLMKKAIDEAVRVCRKSGRIVFLEPGIEGSIFDAEIKFGAWDGDERHTKKDAYEAMTAHSSLISKSQFWDETAFRFNSLEDFIVSMKPQQGTRADWEAFLKKHDFILKASRRIDIFEPL